VRSRFHPLAVTVLLAAAACAHGGASDDDATPDGAGEPDAEPDAPDCIPTGPETCNGLDDDCIGGVDDPFGVGDPCDGADVDLCPDDVVACNAAGDCSD